MKHMAYVVGIWVGIQLLCAGHLQAFSVGEIAVQSHFGAPFQAEVPLRLEPYEQDGELVVGLGDQREYQTEGLERTAVIDHLKATLVAGAHDAIRLASRVPIHVSPFDVVLLVRLGKVTIVRTYHVTLAAAPPAAPSRAAAPPVVAPPPRPAPAPAAPPPPPKKAAAKPPPWIRALPARYGPVRSGATLFGVAEALRVPKEAIWQTIVLIWQANRRQFSGGNLHGLMSGGYLQLPSGLAAKLTTMDNSKAQGIVAEQWEAWQALRRAVTGRQRVAPTRQAGTVVATDAVVPTEKTVTATQETNASTEETSPQVVVLPAEKPPVTAAVTGVQAGLQGLEELLVQRLAQTTGGDDGVTFVNSTDLQNALQGLEERLSERLQQAVQRVTESQRAMQRTMRPLPPVKRQTLLEQLLPVNTMVYVLVVQNALLLLLIGGILWRRFRSRA